MFAAFIFRRASNITKCLSPQCRGYLKRPRDKYRPLVKLPGLKDSTHFKRDRVDAKTVELIYKGPQKSFEMVPPFVLFMNGSILILLTLELLGKTPSKLESEEPKMSAVLPKTDSEFYAFFVITAVFFVGTYIFSKANIVRMYYNVERNYFIASHCNPFWFNTRTTRIQPGTATASKLHNLLVEIPGLRIPQYVDPSNFKAPVYYNILMGYEGSDNLRATPEDSEDMF